MTTVASNRTILAPTPNPESEVFWSSLSEGRFLVPRCRACGQAHWYPRALCPFCFSGDVNWEEASGKGHIYSFSVMRRAPEPYAIAYVTLMEGPTMMTNIVNCDLNTLKIGQAVRLCLQAAENGMVVPMFEPDQ